MLPKISEKIIKNIFSWGLPLVVLFYYESRRKNIIKGDKENAINKGEKPAASPLKNIGAAISDFLGKGFALKPVAALATVVLVMLFGILLFRDTAPDYTINIMMHGRTQVGFRGGQPEYDEFQVKLAGKIKSGDYFRFQTKIDNDAYVYVVFQDSSSNIESLEKGLIAGNKGFSIPDGNKWFQLDKNVGTEKIYLLASKNKIEGFGKKIEDLKSSGIDTIGKVFPEATIQSFSFEHQ